MFYTIYRTLNTVTGEFYIGQHVTEDLKDGYLGSGVSLLESVKRYGKKNFTKEILYVFETAEEMNEKEIEIVNASLLSNPLALNRQPGGYGLKAARKTVVVFDSNKWKRIKAEDYDPRIHITPTTGTIRVLDISNNVWRRVPTQEYHENKDKYLYHSTGRVSVIDMKTSETSSIYLKDYDATKHKKVLGGIVAEVNGTLQYVTREQFVRDNLNGCHINKITVLDNLDGKRKHVTREEYYANTDRYSHLSKGKVTAYDKSKGKYVKISVEELSKNPAQYAGTTKGQRTVWDIQAKQFRNIPKDSFDRRYHRLASDKHILCYNSTGNLIIDFWGSKKDFVKVYGLEIYNQALKETTNYQPKQKHKFSAYVGCSFKLLNWRN